jgi:nucleoid DNA-binding protein
VISLAYSESQFRDLVAEIGEYEKKEVREFFDVLEEAIQHVVQNADRAKIQGLGTLNCNVREKRKARNPATGETFMAPAKIALRFSIEKPLKDAVPSIKKGRALIESRQADKKSKAKQRSSEKVSTGKRGPGRPPKAVSTEEKRGPGRPKKSKRRAKI